MTIAKVNVHANWLTVGGILLTLGVAVSGCARSDGGAPVYYGAKTGGPAATTPIVTSSVAPPPASTRLSGHVVPTSMGGTVIRVGQGDTVYSIARKYNIFPSALVRENDLQPPYKLSPGQSIRLPSAAHLSGQRSSVEEKPSRTDTASVAPRVASNVPARTVRVGRGDTVYAIAREQGVSPRALAADNGLSAPYVLRPGQMLRIPQSGDAAVVSASPAPVSVKKVSSSAARADGTVTVARGDTLYSIARDNGVTVAALERWNGIDDATSLQLGQTLFLSDRSDIGEGGPYEEEPVDAASSAPDVTAEEVAEAVVPKPQIDAPQSAPKADNLPKPVEIASPPPAEKTVETATAEKKEEATPIVTASLGNATGKDGFIWPVHGKILSGYGPKANGLYNDGINIAVKEGTPVRAAKSGVVTYAGEELQGYGKLLLIKHDDGYVTAYAHNSRLLVREGDHVRQGDVIAESGETGEVDQPQLHFQIRKGRKSIDPATIFGSMG